VVASASAPMVASASAPVVASASPVVASAMAPVQTYRRGLLGRWRPVRSWAPMAAPMMTIESSTVVPAESAPVKESAVDTSYFEPPPAPAPSLSPGMVATKEDRPNFQVL
jgi:hypothetical protein